MRRRRVGRREILALALLAGASSDPVLAQSAGEELVRREVQDRIFKARKPLVLHEEPKSLPILSFLWRNGEPTGEEIPAGEQVQVSEVKESALGWRRFVWVKVRSADEADRATNEVADKQPAAGNHPAEQSAGGKEPAVDSGTATVTGWLKLGGQHGAIARFREQLERVDANPEQ